MMAELGRWHAAGRIRPRTSHVFELGEFKQAMLDLNEPENRHLLKHVYGPDGYVGTDHQAYAEVAAIARRYGLLS